MWWSESEEPLLMLCKVLEHRSTHTRSAHTHKSLSGTETIIIAKHRQALNQQMILVRSWRCGKGCKRLCETCFDLLKNVYIKWPIRFFVFVSVVDGSYCHFQIDSEHIYSRPPPPLPPIDKPDADITECEDVCFRAAKWPSDAGSIF